MNKELREAVAMAIAEAEIHYFGPRSSLEQCMNWAHEPNCYRAAADAAISIIRPAVLEEAAKVAGRYVIDRKELHPDVPFENIKQDYKNAVHAGAQYIAAAIRALSKEGE